MGRFGRCVFILIFFLGSLCPLVMIPVLGASTPEDGTVVAVPSLDKGGRLNTDYLKEWGEYFDSHYAMRELLVTGHNLLRSKLMRASTKDVLIGSGGWMYYASTLPDFQGQQTISDDGLESIRYNLGLMRDTLLTEGLRFVFTIAPNKSSIYPEYMPPGYEAHPETSNATRLGNILKESRGLEDKIPYAELFRSFREEKQILYHMADSHWNGRGALLASWTLLHALGRGQAAYQEPEPRDDFTGDLQHMLYPSLAGKEKEYYYDKDMKYEVKLNSNGDENDNFAPRIETANKEKKGTLYMCRDSFGNALLPFMANEYGQAIFTREIPYTLYEAVEMKSKSVLLEVAERHLHYLLDGAPMLMTQRTDLNLPEEGAGVTADIEVSEVSDRWTRVTGIWKPGAEPTVSEDVWVVLSTPMEDVVDPDLEVGKAVSLKDPRIYPAFRVEKDGRKSFELYLDAARLPSGTYDVSVVKGISGSYTRSSALGTCRINSVQIENSGSYGDDVTGDGNEETERITDPKKAYKAAEDMIGSPIEDVIEKIGEPVEHSISPSCQTEGEDGVYTWKTFTVYTQSESIGGDQIVVDVLKE